MRLTLVVLKTQSVFFFCHFQMSCPGGRLGNASFHAMGNGIWYPCRPSREDGLVFNGVDREEWQPSLLLVWATGPKWSLNLEATFMDLFFLLRSVVHVWTQFYLHMRWYTRPLINNQKQPIAIGLLLICISKSWHIPRLHRLYKSMVLNLFVNLDINAHMSTYLMYLYW